MTGSKRSTAGCFKIAIGVVLAVLTLAAVTASCGGDETSKGEVTGSTSSAAGGKVVLMTHSSFAVSDPVLNAFEERSGIKVEILRSDDAGAALSQAILTKSHPLADVLFGVDTTFLSRALDEKLFIPYEAAGTSEIPAQFRLDPQHRVTPIDYGDVCLNYDRDWFARRSISPPDSLDDLVASDYKALTVVENPATSSPGLAFLLATIEEYGEGGWTSYWKSLRAADVLVVDGWDQAYYDEFSAGGGSGERPIVVSYASSPPADVIYAEKPKSEPSIGVVESSCFRQVEFAGILRGASHEAAARKLVDFMLSKAFQEDMPLQMFVFPVDPRAALPAEFRKWAVVPDHPLTMAPSAIAGGRDGWIEKWTDVVLR
jgi:thiamine transport system substrate-binding protein